MTKPTKNTPIIVNQKDCGSFYLNSYSNGKLTVSNKKPLTPIELDNIEKNLRYAISKI